MADGSSEVVTIPTALYRHFDSSGGLLYVGISLSPTYRLSQHCDASPWFQRIAAIKIEWHASRDLALAAEKEAIRAERPEFNVIHNRPDARAAYLAEMAAESCAELTYKVTRFEPAYTPAGVAKATGITEASVRLALEAGDIPYYPTGTNAVAITGWAVIAYLEALQAGAVRLRKNTALPDGTYRKIPNNERLVALLEGGPSA